MSEPAHVAVTRLAPSPTGALHLGNARTFLLNWLLARKGGWKIVLRIEDIDGPRIKQGATDQILDDLRYIGLDWNEGPTLQSRQLDRYRLAIEELIASGHAYPCVCSRREVELAASAPHAEDGSAVYPGTCRGKFASVEAARSASGRETAIRFRVSDSPIEVVDQFAGTKVFHPERELGDFVIAKADGTPAYQLAVVVDDAHAGVSRVVRGDDLLDSTPRQIMLYRALGLERSIPLYWHLPLVVGSDGRRLAKRHGDSRLSRYRALGVPGSRVRSLLFRLSGCRDEADFALDKLSRLPIIFTPDDERFLLDATH